MARQRELGQNQLTLEVGGQQTPLGSSFKVSGRLAVDDQLLRGEDVYVNIVDADGNVVVSAAGYVSGVGFKTHRPKDLPEWVERQHTIKLGD